MKRGLATLLALAPCAAGPLLACTQRSPESDVPTAAETPQPISAAEARSLLASGAVLADVREPHELAETGKLEGALNVPLTAIKQLAAQGSTPAQLAAAKERPVILYCRSGRRSGEAGELLLRQGFRRVYNLGGFEDGVKAGLPVAQGS